MHRIHQVAADMTVLCHSFLCIQGPCAFFSRAISNVPVQTATSNGANVKGAQKCDWHSAFKNKKAELWYNKLTYLRTYLKHLDDRLRLSFRFKRKGKILPWQQDHCQHWHSALTHDTLALCHLKCTSVDSKPGVMAAYG